MKKILFLLLFLPTIAFSQSVFLEKVKQKVKSRIDQKLDQGVEKSLDKTEEELRNATTKTNSKKERSEVDVSGNEKKTSESGSFQIFSRYDFIPGDHIVYAEDFSQDILGEFPLKWHTNNRGAIVQIQPEGLKWLRLLPGGKFVSPALKNLPENFTIEFDLLLQYKSGGEGYPYPNIQIGLLELLTSDVTAKSYLLKQETMADMIVEFSPSEEETSMVSYRSSHRGGTFMSNDWKTLKIFDSYFGKAIRIAVWVQKERLRFWINNEKIYDIPNAVPGKATFNRLSFQTESSMYTEQQLGMYITNIKIAKGTPDMRSKLITEGKLVTNGIHFDVASDVIKSESYGVLKEIAGVLNDNPTVNVKIIGHTDSDGESSKNLELSKRRAASVKNALAKEFKVDEKRIITDGMGEDKPVADNATKEGKLQNRRVEFIRF